MPTILGLAALFLLATDALNMDLSLLPGVSAKNFIIYLIAVVLALRMVISRGSIMAAGQMQGAFIVQIGYATVTWLVAALLIQYPYYDLFDSAIRLKGALIDHYIFFLVFLFGVQTSEDAMKVIKGLLFGALLANAITILDAAGIISLGFRIREDGRTSGAMRYHASASSSASRPPPKKTARQPANTMSGARVSGTRAEARLPPEMKNPFAVVRLLRGTVYAMAMLPTG